MQRSWRANKKRETEQKKDFFSFSKLVLQLCKAFTNSPAKAKIIISSLAMNTLFDLYLAMDIIGLILGNEDLGR